MQDLVLTNIPGSLLDSLELLTQGTTFVRLLQGLWVSVWIALAAMVLAIIFGIFLEIAMTSHSHIMRMICRVYVEFFRLMPQIVLLFLIYFDMTRVAGVNLSGEISALIVFTLWGTAEMGDLVRGAITSIPRHQYESAYALGMTGAQVQRYIVLPLAIRQLIPQTVNLTTRMIKTTPLITLIGVVEVLKVAQQVIDANRLFYPDAALWIYGVVFVIYFVVCYVISALSRRLEKRLS